MADVLSALREACVRVSERARHVQINPGRIASYVAELPGPGGAEEAGPDDHLHTGSREERAAFWLTLDAINFGSGWFPTLRKRPGRSGYSTIAESVRDRFIDRGPWSAEELSAITAAELAGALGQDPDHELMGWFACSLRDLGQHVTTEHSGSFANVAQAAGRSAPALVERLAGWDSFSDTSSYDGVRIPFLKRAQIASADLHRAGVVQFHDLGRLTMFADNLVPHVLRLDGVLRFDPHLVRRIEAGELIQHGSPEEIEIRACAVHAVELLAAAGGDRSPAEIDQALWLRGQGPSYKAIPRHRSRCTAY